MSSKFLLFLYCFILLPTLRDIREEFKMKLCEAEIMGGEKTTNRTYNVSVINYVYDLQIH